MFDSKDESQVVVKSNDKPKKKMSDRNIVFAIAGSIIVLSIVIVLGIMFAMFMGGNSEPDLEGGLGGLQNPNHLTDPDRVTAQDIEDEYQSRPAMDSDVSGLWETSMTQFLSKGDFADLDAFLVEQMKQYKNLEGDEGQGMEDWREKFEMLRSDIAKAVNIKKDSQPAVTFTQFASPEILAAAIAWSPVSVKIDAFEDWSSLILPVPQDRDIFLRVSDIDAPNEVLAQINGISATRYYDLVAYDMTISGNNLRLYIVGDQYGYYRPWSLSSLDGTVNQDIWNKNTILEIKNALDPWSDLDAVLGSLSSYTNGEAPEAGQDPSVVDDGNVIPPEGQSPNDKEPVYQMPEGEDGNLENGEDSQNIGL